MVQQAQQNGGRARSGPAGVAWLSVSIWLALALAALTWSLAGLTIDRSGADAASANNSRELWPFWIASAACWLGLTAMWWMLRKRPMPSAALHGNGRDPSRFWGPALVVLLVAAAARVIVLFTHQPSLSDDIYRYIFEGRTFAAGINPYSLAAADRFGASSENFVGERELLTRVAYPDLPTPYFPATEYVFGAIGLSIGERWSDPDSSAKVFRIAYVAIEIILMGLLLMMLRREGRSAWWLALYAWHPLAISEIAGSGHQDIVGITMMAAALVVFTAKPARTLAWSGWLSMATLVKPVAAPVGILALRTRPWREWFVAAAVGLVIAAALAAPLWLTPGDDFKGFRNWKGAVDLMAERWAHFAGGYEGTLFVARKTMPAPSDERAIGWNLVQEVRVRRLLMVALGLIFIAIVIWQRDLVKAARDTLLAGLLLSTTCFPWYLLWALALGPMRMSWTLWVFSLTLPWGYAVFITGKGSAGGEEFTVPPWIIAAAYVPVALAVAVDLVRARSRTHHSGPPV